jgi:hypothetical protein
MQIDATAGAYGLFQVAFANLTDDLATALFRLRQSKDPNVTFKEIFKLEFKKMLEQFREELKQFDSKPSLAEDRHWIGEAVAKMTAIAQWRNDRIHARVLQVDDGLALYHWRTLKRLSISYEECEEKIQDVIWIIVTVRTHVGQLVERLEWDKSFEQTWDSADTR